MLSSIIFIRRIFTTFWPEEYYFNPEMDKLYQVVINMKHEKPSLPLRLASLATLLLLSGAMLAAGLVQSAPKPESVPAQVQVQAALPDPTDTETHQYLIRDCRGMVCVYRDGALIYKTTIPVASLPEEDRKNLAEGIEVSDETEMHQLLEDFGA